MAFFLDKTGLAYFWDKAKEFIKSKYVAINVPIKGKDVWNDIEFSTTVQDSGIVVYNETENKYNYIDYKEIVSIDDENNNKVVIDSESIRLFESGSEYTRITTDEISSIKIKKFNGTSSQFLMADGSVAEFNKANGVPKLNSSGKLDSSQIDDLTDAEIDAIVV